MDSKTIDANLRIKIFPAPILREKSIDIDSFDQALHNVIAKMESIMHHLSGAGIAANQVGLNKQIALVNVIYDNIENSLDDLQFKNYTDNLLVIINPKIDWYSNETAEESEGCLSFPGIYALVKRPVKVIVSYNDQWGDRKVIKANNLLARCLQHEIDHLNGRLFIDYLNPVKRRMLTAKLLKKNS
ncbi:peptide deformylase [Candidatus Xenohaliotis californiensis]